MIRIRCYEDTDALRRAVARRLADEVTRGGDSPFAVLLSGGSTPFPAYNEVAAQRLAASPHLHLAFTDERYVPPDTPDSNVHNTRPLIDSLRLSDDRVLRVRTELPIADAASDYDQRLDRFLAEEGAIHLALLGLGADGHTCALFSREHLDASKGRLAIAVHRPDGRDGVSVTPELLLRANRLVFLVAGEEKRAALRELVSPGAANVAAQAVAGHPSVEVWTEPTAWPGA